MLASFTLSECWVLLVATLNTITSFWTIYLFSFMYAVGDNPFDSIKDALGINNHQYALVCGPLYCLPALFAAFGAGWLAQSVDAALLLALSSAINVVVNALYYAASRSSRPFLVLAASHVLMGVAAGMQKLTSTLVAERVRLSVIGTANGIVWIGPCVSRLSLSPRIHSEFAAERLPTTS